MYLPVLMSFGFALTTAIQPPIVPFVQQEPTPQWTNTKLGVYRFVNGVTGTALSVSDSSTDSLVVSMPVSENDNAQRWHMIDPTTRTGISLVNNATGGFLHVGQPARAKPLVPNYDSPILDDVVIIPDQPYIIGEPTRPFQFRLRGPKGGFEVLGGNRAPGTPVHLVSIQGGKRAQLWWPQYLGEN